MGKARKSKYAVKSNEKVPLDQQLTAGGVTKSKNKVKIRLRAEEEGVSKIIYFLITINVLLNKFFFAAVCRCSVNTKNFGCRS